MTGHGQITGRHVLFAFLGFFAVVFAVNGVFVYFATSTWTGLATDNAYVRGLAYNRVLEAAEAQRALGWNVRFEVAGTGLRAATISAHFSDADGAPLEDLAVNAEFRRPATEGYDHVVALTAVSPGEYGATVDLPLAGNWDVRLAARQGETEKYIVDQRAWIK